MRRMILGFALGVVVGAAGLALADKTITIKSVTAADFDRVCVDTVGGVTTMSGTYRLKDTAGTLLFSGDTRAIAKTLTAGQITTFVQFVRDTVGLVAAANTAEGL